MDQDMYQDHLYTVPDPNHEMFFRWKWESNPLKEIPPYFTYKEASKAAFLYARNGIIKIY